MYNYYRYGAVEWSEWDDFGLFDSVNAIVAELLEDDSIEFADKRQAILRQALEALCELETGGLFGPRSVDRFVVLCIADSSDEIMLESAKRLNSEAVSQAYAEEFGE